MDLKDRVMAEQEEFIFMDLLESAIIDIASEAHRAAHLGLDPWLNIDEEGEYNLSLQARLSVGNAGGHHSKKSKNGMVDMFGQIHPAVAEEVFECMNCKRKVVAGRFAPHLEKCMGKGSRERSKANSNTKTDLQENIQKKVRKAAEAMTAKVSTKLVVSNTKRAHENGLDIHGRISERHDQEIKRVLNKITKKSQKKRSKTFSEDKKTYLKRRPRKTCPEDQQVNYDEANIL